MKRYVNIFGRQRRLRMAGISGGLSRKNRSVVFVFISNPLPYR